MGSLLPVCAASNLKVPAIELQNGPQKRPVDSPFSTSPEALHPSRSVSRKESLFVTAFTLFLLYFITSLELLPKPDYWASATSTTIQRAASSTETTKDKILTRIMPMAVPGGEAFVSALEWQALQAMLDREQFCLPWEVDSDTWWTHHPDWSVSFENDTHYCFAPMKDPEKSALYRKLYAAQFQTNCSALRTKGMWSSGWGADFSNVIEGLSFAAQNNVPVQMYAKGGWHYAATKQGDRPVCPSADMYCFFLNMSRCEPEPDKMELAFLSGTLPGVEGRGQWEWYKEYATRPHTWLRHEVYQHVKKTAKQMGLDSLQEQNQTCATLHVRRSDVTLHTNANRVYYSIKEYIQGAKETLGHDLPKNIFMLTDDENAVEEAKRDFPAYNWLNMNRTRFRGTSGGWENQIPSGNPKTEVVVLLSTFRLIQMCPIFVHARSSFASYLWGTLQEQLGERAQRVDLLQWMNDNHVETKPTIDSESRNLFYRY